MMNTYNENNTLINSWVLLSLALIAFACAALFAKTETEIVHHLAGGFFGVALGAALSLWGINEFVQGHIKGRRVIVYRAKHPTIFYLLIAGKRFAPGIIMILAGIWFMLK